MSNADRKIAVAGCGLIGRAWAITFARGGYQVGLYDKADGAVSGACLYIEQVLPELQANNLLNGASPGDVMDRLIECDSLEHALDGAEYVQESTLEDVEVKKAVFTQLDEVATPETIIASSTSAILPSAFSEHVPGRHRCLVAHPINPPYLVPAVEVVPAPWTDDDVRQRTGELMRSVGQQPIMMEREIDGFVMNRMQGALLQEAFRLVAGGYASTEDIDIGIREGLGQRWSFMGPFETIDLNAPAGVADYIARFEGMYSTMAQTQRDPVPWTGDLSGKVESERREFLAADKLGERSKWRDKRLMALRAHQNSQTKTDSEQ